MTQDDQNDFTMFSTVRDFMNNHTADTSGVAAIPALVTSLSSIITQIDAAVTAQASPLTGISEDKEMIRNQLEEATFFVSEALSALAAATNNNTLLQEVTISRSKLGALSADDLDAFATRVALRGTSNQTMLSGNYGVTPAQVTAITTARTAFAPWVNKPRTAIAERAAQTALIPKLIRQGKTLLKTQLDKLMSRFRLTNPALYAGYLTARTVVDRRGAGGTPAALEITAVQATGANSAKVTYATTGAAGAESVSLQWKLPSEPVFGHDTPVVRPEQTLSNASWPGQLVTFRTLSTDGTGKQTPSGQKALTF